VFVVALKFAILWKRFAGRGPLPVVTMVKGSLERCGGEIEDLIELR
jgi:hypothetical protein